MDLASSQTSEEVAQCLAAKVDHISWRTTTELIGITVAAPTLEKLFEETS